MSRCQCSYRGPTISKSDLEIRLIFVHILRLRSTFFPIVATLLARNTLPRSTGVRVEFGGHRADPGGFEG